MKRKIFTLLVALAATMMCQAEVVTADQALAVARGFVNQSGGKLKAGAPLKLAYQAYSLDGKPDYYVFNNGTDGGFIVVSGDDRTVPVWGYSTSGSFDYESMPDNAKWWYSEYQRQLQYLRDNPKVKARKPVKLTTSVDPMLTTKWDQCYPYNMKFPETPGSGAEYNDKAPTGCAATAVAQIMKKHEWPRIGYGSMSYWPNVKWLDNNGVEHSKDVNLGVDFTQSVYHWNLMQDDYTNGETYSNDEQEAVAKLMYDVAIAICSDFKHNGTPAEIEDVEDAFNTFFSYTARTEERDGYEGDWDAMLMQAIDAGLPIYYRADRKDTEGNYHGHAFVFDGYNEEGMFDVNWGWGDIEANGYYYSSLLKPRPSESRHYQYRQKCVIADPNRTGKSFSAVMTNRNYNNVNKNSQASSSLSVYGQNLDQDVSISLSGDGASMFSTVETVTSAEANSEGGKTVKVIYHPTATGDHVAQLTVSAGDGTDPITFTISGNSCVNYDANGDETADVADVVAAINAVLNEEDLNFDDNPDISTIVAMINAIINDEIDIDLDDGLVAYYPFDGDAHDASGHGNDGEVHDLWAAGGVNGDTNGAWHFGGYDHPGYIRIPNSESLQFTDGFSFACYVKPLNWSGMDSNGNYSDRGRHCIFAKDHNNTGPVLGIELNDNLDMGVDLHSAVDSWCALSSGDRISGNKLSEWVHIAVTYSKTKARLYVDGLLVDERDINADFSSMNGHDLYLGKYSDYWYPFKGVMDEVRVYNRRLNSSEVRDLAADNLKKQEEKHPFKLSEKAVTLAVGETVTVNMINGTGSYCMGSTTSIVDFNLDREGEFFTLTGTGIGNTNVSVTDVNTQTTIYLPVTVTEPLGEVFTVNDVSFTMVPVDGGTFTMGATAEQGDDAKSNELPTHQVTLSSFAIGQTEVTQALWQAVMGSNPSSFQGDLNRPVEQVSWDDCQTFISKLNEMTGRNFRLPTEAEWEFAARGGNQSQGHKYAGSDNVDEVAWYKDNSDGTTHPVGSKMANELGLYDMSGNVYEFCQDYYDAYSSEAQTNPTGPANSPQGAFGTRIIRGSCWYYDASGCRVTKRDAWLPSYSYYLIGLRLAL